MLDASKMLEFAAFVRDSDSLTEEDSVRLAVQFDLPEELVRDALKVAGAQQARSKVGNRSKRLQLTALFAALARCLYERPIISSCVIGVTMGVGSQATGLLHELVGEIVLASVILVGLGLVIVINALRGQARYSVLTAFSMVSCALITDSLIGFVGGKRFGFAETFGLFALILFFTALSAMFLSLVAMLGAFVKIRREASEEERLDRLYLLQRIFDLQERLTSAPASGWVRGRWAWIEKLRERWPWVSIVAGFGVGFIFALEKITFGMSSSDELAPAGALLVFINVLLIGVIVAAVGFVSGNFVRGLLAGLLFSASKVVIQLATRNVGTFDVIVVSSLFLSLLAGIAGVAGLIEERAQKHRRIASADQTAILNEIIRLQKLLQTGAADVFVMFVDVVKSTSLKAGKDPLKVEASFRAFHEFVGHTVRHHGGSVHSVSGDGAVVEFNSASDCLAAACALQRDIEAFNRNGNRLDSPFRIRIGLHCGKVHGELDQVMFTSVVDIAAHIEKFAPPGGIVVSDEFRERLDGGRFAKLDEQVDGQGIHLILDPTT